MEMKSKVVMVDPTLAESWLQKNAQHNRAMRKFVVAGYAQQMRDGEWKLTHQGVAFDVNGVLIDGQHRLAAIVEAGVIVPMMVTVNAPSVSFESLDCGIKRTVADRLVMDKKVVAVLTLAFQIAIDKHDRVSEHQIRQLSQTRFGEFASLICASHQQNVRVFSSSSVTIAAAVNCVEGQDLDWVIEQRRILISPRYEDHKTRVSEYFRHRFEGKRIISSNQHAMHLEVVACALPVFSTEPWNHTKMQLSYEWRAKVRNRVQAAIGYKKGE